MSRNLSLPVRAGFPQGQASEASGNSKNINGRQRTVPYLAFFVLAVLCLAVGIIMRLLKV